MLMATAAHAEARQAARLLDLWSRLSSRHIALGSSCACGAGGVTLVLDDFELDIYGYLQDSAERGDVEEARAFFAASTATEADARPLLTFWKRRRPGICRRASGRGPCPSSNAR